MRVVKYSFRKHDFIPVIGFYDYVKDLKQRNSFEDYSEPTVHFIGLSLYNFALVSSSILVLNRTISGLEKIL
ncbi:hypothetical protein EXS72_02560 [Candidatus Pacearchaeota archaeon]|nr:hypothetical protein [Candidatus Pacearchaeota archaeon]